MAWHCSYTVSYGGEIGEAGKLKATCKSDCDAKLQRVIADVMVKPLLGFGAISPVSYSSSTIDLDDDKGKVADAQRLVGDAEYLTIGAAIYWGPSLVTELQLASAFGRQGASWQSNSFGLGGDVLFGKSRLLSSRSECCNCP
jgi:hypothetical protein